MGDGVHGVRVDLVDDGPGARLGRGKRVCVVGRHRRAAEARGERLTWQEAARQAIPGWLVPRLAAAGLEARESHIAITGHRRQEFWKDPQDQQAGGAPIVLATTDTTGVAILRDPQLLQDALLQGIGRGGAWGAGMLTLQCID